MAKFCQVCTEGGRRQFVGHSWTSGFKDKFDNVIGALHDLPLLFPKQKVANMGQYMHQQHAHSNVGKSYTMLEAARRFGCHLAFFHPFCSFVLFLRSKNPIFYRGIKNHGIFVEVPYPPSKTPTKQYQTLQSHAEFDADSEFAIKPTPRLQSDCAMHVQSQSIA
jgi:hypothetical protein